MLMIDMAMTELAHVQRDVVLSGELYWGVIIGAFVASGLWYFLLNYKGGENINKLSF